MMDDEQERKKLAKAIVDEALYRFKFSLGDFVFSKLFGAIILLVIIAAVYFGLIDIPHLKGV